jgi:hypothetical protein
MKFLRRNAVVGAMMALTLLALVLPAQAGDWILARALHISLPGDPHAGGVPWAKENLGLPTSWSTEAGGLRVEIAELFSTGQASQEIERVIPGAKVQQTSISGYPAWEGGTDSTGLLAIQTARRLWMVVVRNGAQNAQAIFRTVTVERDGPPNWQRRTWGNFPLATMLPYDLAPDRRAGASDARRDYELKFDGFSITESVQRAEAGAKLDFKKTVDDDVNAMKKHAVYKDVKVERERIKDLPGGEMVQYTFTEQSRAKKQFYIVGERNGAGLQIRWTFDANNPVHVDYSNRILLSFKEERANLGGLQTWKAGRYGFWLDVPGALEPSQSSGGMEEWQRLFGLLLVTTRVTDNTAHGINPGQIADLLDAKFRAYPDAKDYKSEKTPVIVSGIEGALVRAKFKSKNMDTYRWGLVVQTYEKTYVVEILGVDEVLVRRIVDSVKLDLGVADKLKAVTFKSSPFTVRALEDTKPTDSQPEPGIDAVQMVQINDPGKLSFTAVYQKTSKGAVLLPNDFMKKYVDELGKAVKAKPKVLAQGTSANDSAVGAWTRYDLEVNGKPLTCWSYVLVKGDQALIMTVLVVSQDPTTLSAAQVLMNSVQVSN